MRVGIEWLVDAYDCPAAVLRQPARLQRVCQQILTDLELLVVGEGVWHQFPPPGGLTGLFLLTESHLACHTYPKKGVATFNLYCCRARRAWPWRGQLRALLGASRVTVRTAARGATGCVLAPRRKGGQP